MKETFHFVTGNLYIFISSLVIIKAKQIVYILLKKILFQECIYMLYIYNLNAIFFLFNNSLAYVCDNKLFFSETHFVLNFFSNPVWYDYVASEVSNICSIWNSSNSTKKVQKCRITPLLDRNVFQWVLVNGENKFPP